VRQLLRNGLKIMRDRPIEAIPVTPIDHLSSLPANVQIEQDLRRLIKSGQISGNSRLPRETTLASMYGVSRMTLRQALARLSESKLIKRRQGGGTVVLAPPGAITCKLSLMLSLTEQLKIAGYRTRSVVQVCEREMPPPAVSQLLKMAPGEYCFFVRRLITIDGFRFAISQSWLSEARVPALDKQDFEDGSLWKTLRKQYRIRPRRGLNRLEVLAATAYEAEQLQVTANDTLVRLTALIFDARNRPFEHSATLWEAKNVRFQFSSTLEEEGEFLSVEL
jgi:GntR family transcriptional regulator